jgi:cytochrome d ubiquinol oxidase subunit II
MFLDTLPLVFVLAGLVLYTVLGGADFGAGAWRLLAGRGEAGARVRDHAHHSMGPVWEANHVWLIFVLTVTWTAYPRFLGSLASTLDVPLLIAGLGIIVRGASYAIRSAADTAEEVRKVDTGFAIVSLITPFALGTCIGALAAQRVPVGNAAGGLFSSWTGPVSILTGALAVVFSAYLAAVFLAADARRRGEPELVRAMRRRALASGAVAGILAVVGLIVLHADVPSVYHGLTHGAGLVAVVVSGVAGAGTVLLVLSRRFETARYTAALAVAAVVTGWVLARWPQLLPGLTIRQAAAPHDTLVWIVVVVLAGGAMLFPSLALLFSLTLRGQLLGHAVAEAEPAGPSAPLRALVSAGRGVRLAAALLIAGVGLLNGADAGWAHAIGVLSLLGFIGVGFATIVSQADERELG